MSRKELTPERVREVWEYDPNTGNLVWRSKVGRNTRLGHIAGTLDGYGYRIVTLKGTKYSVSRLVWAHVHGSWPEGRIVHVNKNKDDNRIENLSRQSDDRLVTKELVQELFRYDAETGTITWRTARSNAIKVGDVAGKPSDSGYLIVRINGKHFRAHRLVWMIVHGTWPDGDIDHVNGDRSDNRINNLRVATRSQNLMNSKLRSNNTTGYKGVCFYKARGNWIANITTNGKRRFLGYFNTPEEAHEAYCNASEKYHGEFGRTK